jgi:hypothetical protein
VNFLFLFFKASQYLEFVTIGNRVHFEKTDTTRRVHLCSDKTENNYVLSNLLLSSILRSFLANCTTTTTTSTALLFTDDDKDLDENEIWSLNTTKIGSIKTKDMNSIDSSNLPDLIANFANQLECTVLDQIGLLSVFTLKMLASNLFV